MKEKVEHVLELIRPALQMDGGDCQLVDVDEGTGVVKIHFVGACDGCPMSSMTLQMGIERAIRDRVPEVTAVEPV